MLSAFHFSPFDQIFTSHFLQHLYFVGSVVNPDPELFKDSHLELFVQDTTRMKEQIIKILFIILGLWILDCSTVGL